MSERLFFRVLTFAVVGIVVGWLLLGIAALLWVLGA